MSRAPLGWLTVARALEEGLVNEVADVAGLSKAETRARLESARGNTKVRNAFDDLWPFADQELGGTTAACAVEHDLRRKICRLTSLDLRAVSRRLKSVHGKVLLRNLFEDEWPTAIDFAYEVGGDTAADALRRPVLLGRVREICGLSEGEIKRRLRRAHGNTLICNVLADEWPHGDDYDDQELDEDDIGEEDVDEEDVDEEHVAPDSRQPERDRDTGGRLNEEKLFGRYIVMARLKPGAIGEVFKVRDTESGALRFMKRVPRASKHQEASLRREQQIYNKLINHDFAHVLPVHGIERDEDYFALILEFASGGALDQYVPKNGLRSSVEVKSIAMQIARGLEELHALNVVHRDLKPGNVLQHASAWKLADFGIARDVSVNATTTFKGDHTPGYAAPEQINRTEAASSADVYSLGKVITFMLTGQTDPDRIALPGWQQLVHRCTERDPDHRPSSTEVIKSISRM